MDTILIEIFENGLHPQAKLLYSILRAYAGADGMAVVAETHVAAIMRISPARLRGYRSALNASGYCSVKMSGGELIFRMNSDHKSLTGDDQDEPSDHLARDSDHGPGTNDTAETKSDHSTRDSDHLARDSDHGPDTNDTAETKSDHSTRDSDHLARDSARRARAGGDNRGGWLVGNSLPTSREKNLPTNQPVAPSPKLAAWEVEASQSLLLAVGCENLPAVAAVAQDYPFEEVRAHALAWQRDTKTTGPGGLLHRIRSGDFVAPELSDDDRRSSLFRRHRTPSEVADEERQRREWQAEEERRFSDLLADDAEHERQTAIRQHGLDPDELWIKTLAELRNELPTATFDTWLIGSTASKENNILTIHATDEYAKNFLAARLTERISRIASRAAGREITIKIE